MLTGVVLAAVLADVARADPIGPARDDKPPFVAFAVPLSGSGTVPTLSYQVQDLVNQLDPSLQPTFLDMLSLVEPMEIEDYLTINGTGGDWDKDGFLETTSGDVNPLGYVVFHFRDQDQNVRVLLGFLLSDPAIAPAPSPSGGDGPDGGTPPAPSPSSEVPEPTTLVLLAGGGTVLMWRRTRRS